jgi:MFS family permease
VAKLPVAVSSDERGASFGMEFRQQWPLILALFLMQVFAFGFPAFALPFVYAGATEEFGWTRQQAVLLASYKFYVSAAAALVVGRLLDTISPKYIVAIAAVLGALGMAGFMLADNLIRYYALGVILGLNGAGLAVAINVIASRAFDKSIGTMLGVVLSGTSVAGMLLPIFIAPLMGTIGWRPAMAILSCGIWLVSLPVWFLVFRRGSPIDERLRKGNFGAVKIGMWGHFKRLAGTRDFWFIFVGGFLVMSIDQALIQNQVLFEPGDGGVGRLPFGRRWDRRQDLIRLDL